MSDEVRETTFMVDQYKVLMPEGLAARDVVDAIRRLDGVQKATANMVGSIITVFFEENATVGGLISGILGIISLADTKFQGGHGRIKYTAAGNTGVRITLTKG